MEEARASQIIKAAVSLDASLGELDILVSGISDEIERKEFARRLGDVMGNINDFFIRPLVKKFPHLDPDQK